MKFTKTPFLKQCRKGCPKSCSKSVYAGSVSITEIPKRLIVLAVGMETWEVDHLEGIPKYDAYIITSNLGGVFGLFIGFSLLTAVELLVLVFDMAYVMCSRLGRVRL